MNILENLKTLLTPANVIAFKEANNAEYQFLADRINNNERNVIAVVTPDNLDQLRELILFSADKAFSLFNL
ncbi:MAG: FAD-binding oxidoreductase, partial [Cycloclasticus sp.]